jgi:hypothetical protein
MSDDGYGDGVNDGYDYEGGQGYILLLLCLIVMTGLNAYLALPMAHLCVSSSRDSCIC